jgi:Na+-driven multidrug efflux pump
VRGAALAVVASRLTWIAIGVWRAVWRLDLIGSLHPVQALRDFKPVMLIALPVILTNLATPVANIYATREFSQFGAEVIAALAIIDRVTPIAFGVLFALSGAVGPIISQNFGARRLDRIHETLMRSYGVTLAYVLVMWGLLALAAPLIVALFSAEPATAAVVIFYCRFGAVAWLFLGFLFTANAAFNNLGYPVLSTTFNWGRATIGTMPLVTYGVSVGGIEGGILAIAAGAAFFGTSAAVTSFYITRRLARQTTGI